MKRYHARRLLRILGIVLVAYLSLILFSCILHPLWSHPASGPDLPVLDPQLDAERVLCIEDNTDALLWRLRVIESAQEHITLSTFQLGVDQSGMEIMAALKAAADRGVKVQLLIDGGFGALPLPGSDIFHALASTENVEIRIYNPICLWKPWKANYRLHDKYLVADDSTYILGGRNTMDLFLGDYSPEKNIDRDLLVCTDQPQAVTSIDQVQQYFAHIWEEPTNRPVRPKNGQDIVQAAQALDAQYAALHDRYPEAFTPLDWETQTLPAHKIQLLTNPTTATRKEPLLWNSLQPILAQGKDILFQTPYIICDQPMYQQLTELTEHCKLQLVTNAVENGANPWGCSDFLNSRQKILDTGAEVFSYAGGDSLHAKTILIDDHISLVGSYNLDLRSTNLNTELMLVVDSPALNAQLRETLDTVLDSSLHTLSDGTEIPGEAFDPPAFGPWKKLVYGVLRLVILPIRHLL